jgi:hypothetical protein
LQQKTPKKIQQFIHKISGCFLRKLWSEVRERVKVFVHGPGGEKGNINFYDRTPRHSGYQAALLIKRLILT